MGAKAYGLFDYDELTKLQQAYFKMYDTTLFVSFTRKCTEDYKFIDRVHVDGDYADLIAPLAEWEFDYEFEGVKWYTYKKNGLEFSAAFELEGDN